MKKSMILGAAALAAVAFAPTADAGTVSFGGYYRIQALNMDNLVNDAAAATPEEDDYKAIRHRLELKMDMQASDKTHAHMVMRPVDNDIVDGAGSSYLESSVGARAIGNSGGRIAGANANWQLTQLWLETEAFGVGVKAGNMPIQLNDKILVNDDGDSSFGGIVLSKTFNGVTAVLADIKVSEGGTGMTQVATGAAGSDDDDADLYVLSLLGSANSMNYNVTLAYADAEYNSPLGATTPSALTTNLQDGTSNWWLAGTLSGDFNGIGWVGTAIYEAGYDNINTVGNAPVMEQLEGSGFMVALRMHGKASFGGWNVYGFYGDEDFDSVTNRPNWSHNYAADSADLMHNVLMATGLNSGNGGPNANDSGENTWGLGAGLTMNMGGWTINPQLDYVSLTEDTYEDAGVNNAAVNVADVDSAWGGTLILSTQIDEGTTLSLIGQYVDADDNDSSATSSMVGKQHAMLAQIKMKF